MTRLWIQLLAGALFGISFRGLVDSYELTIAAAAVLVVGAPIGIPASIPTAAAEEDVGGTVTWRHDS